MPQYIIKVNIEAELIVEANNLKEARTWKDKIVTDIQDENGNQIKSEKVIDLIATISDDYTIDEHEEE